MWILFSKSSAIFKPTTVLPVPGGPCIKASLLFIAVTNAPYCESSYLHSTSCKEGFDFSCFGSGLGTLDISKEQNWPKASTLSLDDSQYGALKILLHVQ
jgi:hypothetical protein